MIQNNVKALNFSAHIARCIMPQKLIKDIMEPFLILMVIYVMVVHDISKPLYHGVTPATNGALHSL